jgi:hypothetical protein
LVRLYTGVPDKRTASLYIEVKYFISCKIFNMGYDFSIFWQLGRGILDGQSPYSLVEPHYPPAAILLFTLFAILPYLPSFAVWTGINFILYLNCLKRLKVNRWGYTWFLFVPTVFNFISGQLDIFYFWVALFLTQGGWKAALAGALLTTKPQIAFIALPWFLARWLLKDRRLLLRWTGLTLALHLLPLLYNLDIYAQWAGVVNGEVDWRIYLTPGVFTLSNYNVTWPVMAGLAAAISIWGLFQDHLTGWISQTLALPIGQWYDETLLVGSAPWWLAVPASWAAFGLSAIVQNAVPMAAIPVILLGWRFFANKFPKRAQFNHRDTESTEKSY